MMYVEPAYSAASFTCPHCEAVTGQQWQGARTPVGGGLAHEVAVCMATTCRQYSIWVGTPMPRGQNVRGRLADDAQVVWPPIRRGPQPNPDLDTEIINDYQEAREVFGVSPRAAAALLRLCLQKLMVQLDQPGKDINDDIAALVKAGLRPDIQQAADIVRVTGNDAVHPGQIDTDNPETVLALFDLVNIIAEDRISQPARVRAIFESLPAERKAAIERRDGSSK